MLKTIPKESLKRWHVIQELMKVKEQGGQSPGGASQASDYQVQYASELERAQCGQNQMSHRLSRKRCDPDRDRIINLKVIVRSLAAGLRLKT